MQWQIVRLEVTVAEQDEKLKEVRQNRDIQYREVVRTYNMCSDLRFELENAKEERDNAARKVTRLSGTDDERAQEMERLAEDCARAWEVTELWKKRVKAVELEAKAKLAEVRCAALFTLERKEWLITRTGSCYHSHECNHVVKSANVKHLKPCAYCVPPAIGAVLASPGSSLSGITQ